MVAVLEAHVDGVDLVSRDQGAIQELPARLRLEERRVGGRDLREQPQRARHRLDEVLCALDGSQPGLGDLLMEGRDDGRRGPAGKASATWNAGIWLGIEAGVEAFCGEARITSDQLLALAGGRPEFVEMTGRWLCGKARVNRRCEEATRQELSQAWAIGKQS